MILPKELQDLIGEFNVEHRPKMLGVFHQLKMRYVFSNLLENYKKRNYCMAYDCGYHVIDENYTRYIYWRKYTFCSDWCQYDTEMSIRKRR